MTVFVPITVTAAQALRSGGRVDDAVGYADGPALRRWLGETALDDEEAAYIALNHAGVAALLLDASSRRLVLAVDREIRDTDELGSVRLAEIHWADVRSLFADDAEATEAVDAARDAVRGRDLPTALAEPSVQDLQGSYDLLWYAPEELDALS